ncbi:hypothetical protein VTN31DRAFT_6735 [Thermomyces dupontii]|uniref:uncharacterized protein n=1 Tax=Talaromyces thermophilus TaxID=28565 RepID=UPI00374411E9
MSVSCIVCLGDLAASPSPSASERLPSPDSHSVDDELGVSCGPGSEAVSDSAKGKEARNVGQIARMLPCRHVLHDDCLRPWVERANSCPICRQSFNVVELLDALDGPVVSTYAVQDKAQEADFDPTQFLEEISDACPYCQRDDNEHLLLLCEGCDIATHTYCIGLQFVPDGPWYCERCEARQEHGIISSPPLRGSRQNRRTQLRRRSLRSRSQQGSNSRHSSHSSSEWDLNIPLAADQQCYSPLRPSLLSSAERRARATGAFSYIGELNGSDASSLDRNTLLSELGVAPSRPRAPRAPTPEPESLEEASAWSAFEEARRMESDASTSRKRKSTSLSPSPEPERRLKRPRTKKDTDLAAMGAQSGETSRLAASRQADDSSGPTFLTKLLDEIAQSGTTPVGHTHDHRNASNRSSPSLSPVSSPHSSPQLSPSLAPTRMQGGVTQLRLGRPSSPSSSIYSPPVSPTRTRESSIERLVASAERRPGQSSAPTHRPGPSAGPGASEASTEQLSITPSGHQPTDSVPDADSIGDNSSPPRPSKPPREIKDQIKKLVKKELDPFYKSSGRAISRDNYKRINYTVCHMLYNKVATADRLDAATLAELQSSAREKVRDAVHRLQAQDIQQQQQDNQGRCLHEARQTVPDGAGNNHGLTT